MCRREAGADKNIRVAVLLSDKADGKTVAEERLTLLLSDWQEGSLRRNVPGIMPGWNRNFEVDVRPMISGNKIQLRVKVNYHGPRDSAPRSEDTKPIPEMVEFIESATALMDSGKPAMLIDSHGDPSNRRVSVQATATIVK